MPRKNIYDENGVPWWRQPKEAARRKSYMAKYAREKPDVMRASFTNWRSRNADYDRARCLQWQKLNPAQRQANVAAYDAAKSRRTVVWANDAAMLEIYEQARKLTESTGIPHEVDHEIPLRGRLVSGLHCEANLRVITAAQNRSKSNKHG